MYNLQKKSEALYVIPQEGAMRVPGLIVATEKLLQEIDMEQPLQQTRNVACLPGIVGYSIAMPDMHWGYGFPIGGVAAMDWQEGVISPGGVGYDINCGVRLAVVPTPFRSLTENQKTGLLKTIFSLIPSGVGRGNAQKTLTRADYERLVEKGARWSIEQGYGLEIDLEHTESGGVIAGGDIRVISDRAQERGANQLGSIGSGNHFVEIGEIRHVYLPEIAAAWGIEEGQIYVLIHSGSRGFGHQVCQDALDRLISRGYAQGLPDKQLVAAPIQSEEGRIYFSAMAAAANFAFNNRQRILHAVRIGVERVLKIPQQDVRLIYDVCHNIAKKEEHEVEGKKKTLCVHRKGATRAFGPGNKELALPFQKTGQPVLVPGDMGRASYLMAGEGNALTWQSACHGAGRARSRVQSAKAWKGKNPIEHMKNQGVLVMAESAHTVKEEMPEAYKNVDDVAEATEKARLAKRVARLYPALAIKG